MMTTCWIRPFGASVPVGAGIGVGAGLCVAAGVGLGRPGDAGGAVRAGVPAALGAADGFGAAGAGVASDGAGLVLDPPPLHAARAIPAHIADARRKREALVMTPTIDAAGDAETFSRRSHGNAAYRIRRRAL